MNAPKYKRRSRAYAFAALQSACAVVTLHDVKDGTAKFSGGLIGGFILMAAIIQTKYQVFKGVIIIPSPAPAFQPLHKAPDGPKIRTIGPPYCPATGRNVAHGFVLSIKLE